ncbi:hypothetical protein K32_08240 [Kaistia sp. 32K]|uniref:ABC transporter substrate-binding protein n=1 Tax=Kaistia sp. 32K TaxID=2795690 RepID=UPI00191631F1|nr:ABC transporter substrate-binding protein [Kaistia sp. 32K]BCP52207.1 hypothetical protein K32_08240 [Kaistia sp. 32K]
MSISPVSRPSSGYRAKRSLKALAAALLLGGAAVAPAFAADPLPVTIGMSSRNFQPGIANMWIGQPLGLFGPDIAATTMGTQGGTENLVLMLAGRVTVSTGTQDIVLNGLAEGRDVPAVSPCVYLHGLIQRVDVLPDSPINSYADLAGKRIGIESLASSDTAVLKFLLRHSGVDPDSVTFLAVGAKQQAAAALRSRQVDGIILSDTAESDLIAAGVDLKKVPLDAALEQAAVGYTWAFAKNWYDGNKDAAAKVMQGMIKSIIVATQNPEAAVRISFHMHPEALPAGVPLDDAVANGVRSIKVRAPLVTVDRSKGEKWCEFTPAQWTGYVDMLGLTGKVDPSVFYTPELIDKINDFDEAALRKWADELKVPVDAGEYQRWVAELKAP